MARKRKPNGCKAGVNTSRYADCRTGDDLLRRAATHPDFDHVENGRGSHKRVVTRAGEKSDAIPTHAADLGTGLRCKLVKSLVAIGLAALALVGLLQIDVLF